MIVWLRGVFLCSELLYSQNKSLYLEIRIREC